MNWKLDERLETTSVEICNLALSNIRLVNDSRWPWLLLIPRVPGAIEVHDLEQADIVQAAVETSQVAQILKQYTDCRKINTAAIGNMVEQLHIHVVARNTGDANWPGPIWGYGEPVQYDNPERDKTLADLANRFEEFLV
ncbi:MAG: HIT family protein [Pseudomonadota bacterium]